MACIHGALSKGRGILTSSRKETKKNEEILSLLEAAKRGSPCLLQRPSEEEFPEVQGNRAADLVTQKAVRPRTSGTSPDFEYLA